MKDKLLLHACCGLCSSAIIEEYHKYFDITLYYYNPCITNADEYYKRAEELNRIVSELSLENEVRVYIENNDTDAFYKMVKGLENQPECGARCYHCYKQRLEKTAEFAKRYNYNYFTTTLTISPYKNSATINNIGINVAHKYKVFYMSFDFGYLYPRSLELCEKYNIYQQNYCGCEYSK